MPTAIPSDFVKKYAPWSISKLNAAAQCPHLFHLKYVDKPEMVATPMSVDAMIGTAVHRMVEFALQGHAVAKAYKAAIVGTQLVTAELERVRAFMPAITVFIRRLTLYRQHHNVQTPILEKKWSVSFDGAPLGFWDRSGFLRGAVDLHALFAAKPYALLLDHKSGKAKPLDSYTWQFKAYSLLLKAHNPQIEKVQTGINHLFTESIDMSAGLTDVRDVGGMVNAFVVYANEQTRLTYNHLQTRKGPLCGWCDFKPICPAHTEQHNGSKK
jgi:putative RecB family exonuclease